MNLPPAFIATITSTFGEDGESLLANLPALIAAASARWGLRDVRPVPMLSYNFVAFAEQADREVVLKIGVPRDELTSEMTALRLFNGQGACRLLEADEGQGWLLLERLRPGEMLATLADDEAATHIAAEVMQRIWRPLDSNGELINAGQQADRLQNFIKLADWFGGLNELRARFAGGTGPLDEALVARVERSVQELLQENHQPVLMHGDFHHFNILSSERGWLVIDPKGVLGPAGYEIGPLMINPWGSLSNGASPQRVLRRVDILHEHLGWERERILEWSLAHGILSAWWGLDENTGWEYALGFARLIAGLRV